MRPIRDGIWTANGLCADFRHLYAHPNCNGIHRVQVAGGEHYVHESELVWDSIAAFKKCPSRRKSPNEKDTQ